MERDMTKLTRKQLLEDVRFLADRSARTGGVMFDDRERDTGMSSNSIVAAAYGVKAIDLRLPGDRSDLRACENMWTKLPEHRKTIAVIAAMENARMAL